MKDQENLLGLKKKLVSEALEIFFDLRKIPGLKKKPSTSELIDWLKLLLSDDMLIRQKLFLLCMAHF